VWGPPSDDETLSGEDAGVGALCSRKGKGKNKGADARVGALCSSKGKGKNKFSPDGDDNTGKGKGLGYGFGAGSSGSSGGVGGAVAAVAAVADFVESDSSEEGWIVCSANKGSGFSWNVSGLKGKGKDTGKDKGKYKGKGKDKDDGIIKPREKKMPRRR
jgi:hypothetical protein